MVWRILYLSTCSLVLAGIVHIAIIFLIPALGSKDAARRISEFGQPGQLQRIRDGQDIGISDRDPFFQLAVCRYDLSENAFMVAGGTSPTFWSASVFDELGRVVYSLNDRTAIKNQLRLIILNPIQMADLRETQPEEIETSIVVETVSNKGFVLIRILNEEETWLSRTREFLDNTRCNTYRTR